MPSITPSLWFDYNLEDAAGFYTSVFPKTTAPTIGRASSRPFEKTQNRPFRRLLQIAC